MLQSDNPNVPSASLLTFSYGSLNEFVQLVLGDFIDATIFQGHNGLP